MRVLKDWEEEVMEALLLGHGERGVCECCKQEDIMVPCGSRRLDSNTVHILCPVCASEHHEYWDDMWADYWSSIL